MLSRRLLVTVALVAAGAATSLAGCGGPPPAKTAKVAVGTMPADGTFKGIWFNPVFGHLHLIPNGSTLNGKWENESKGKWGRMTGTISGDVARFEWEEFAKGGLATDIRKGKGYFKYVPKADPDPPKLQGEWGFEQSEIGGGSWDCVYETNREPDFSKVGAGDENDGGGWDKQKGKK